MAAAAILQNKKSPYLSHGSSNFNEIWHDDAVQPSWLFRSLNIWNFKKSKMAMVANLKNRKIAISRPRFQQFQRNLARWCSSTLLTVLHRYKFENQYFSATVCLVGTAFGTMTHIGPPNRTSSWNFEILKIQDGGRPPSWKMENVVLMDIINSLLKTGNKTANINLKTAVYTHR